MQVLVRDKNVDPVLKVLKKKMQREGLLPMKARVVSGAPGTVRTTRSPRFDLECQKAPNFSFEVVQRISSLR